MKPVGLEHRRSPSILESINGAERALHRYLLAVCTFTPLYGRLCDVLGRRRANQLAVGATALGTIACAFSRDMKMLVAARFVSSTPMVKRGFLIVSAG